jgi:hypothetical protein
MALKCRSLSKRKGWKSCLELEHLEQQGGLEIRVMNSMTFQSTNWISPLFVNMTSFGTAHKLMIKLLQQLMAHDKE